MAFPLALRTLHRMVQNQLPLRARLRVLHPRITMKKAPRRAPRVPAPTLTRVK